MSTLNGGPGNIVTNGLILYLDAANSLSYVSGSSTWRDLSSSNLSGSLENSPGYSSGNGGSIVFDGVDDYLLLTNVTSSTLAFTWDFWINIDPIQPNNPNFWCYLYGFNNSTVEIGVYNSGSFTNSLAFTNYDNAPTRPYISVSSSLGNWINVTLGCNNLIPFMYQNGGNYTTTTAFQNLNLPVANLFRSQGYNGRYMKARIANFKIYNRALTASEVLQNYNSTKARFGL
jgi:hypothetical protein